jgi:iron complex outermembrane recepter protein
MLKKYFGLSVILTYSAISYTVSAEEIKKIKPPVIVIKDPLNSASLEYTKPVTILDRNYITNHSQTTLGETIGLAPGVSSSFFGQGASRPVIRGFAGDRVRVLRNGLGTGDVSNLSEDHLVVGDPLQADQIEILRGPETLLYGNTAIGGAVNITEKAITEEPLGVPFKSEILGQLGNSADNEKSTAVKLQGEASRFNWYVSSFLRQTDSYEIPKNAESDRLMELEEAEELEEHGEEEHGAEEEIVSGKLPNSDTDTWGATVGGSYMLENGFIGVSVSGFNSNYGIPGHSDEHEELEIVEDEATEEESVRIDAKQNRIDLKGRFDNVSDNVHNIKFKLGLSDYEHVEIEGTEQGTKFERNALDSRIEVVHSLNKDIQGVAGLQFSYDDFSAIGEEAIVDPVKTLSPALFAFEKMYLAEQFSFDYGGRIELVNYNHQILDDNNFMPFSISAGPVWNNGNYSIGLTMAYAERAPSPIELFVNGPHLARQIFEIGNVDLGKERSYGIDLLLRKNTGIITGSLTPFIQNFSNYINLSSNGTEEEDLPVYSYNAVDAYFWGFELQNTFHFDQLVDTGIHGVAIDTQVDYVRARDTDNSDNIPRIPPLRTILRGRYNLDKTLQFSVEGVFVQAQKDVAPNEIPTSRYNLLNTEVSYRLPLKEKNSVNLFARASNLTNEEARIHSSFIKDLAPIRGRAVLFGIKMDL